MIRRPTNAVAAILALATVTVALIVILAGPGEGYTLRAQFIDASQLVKGDLVEVGGRKVGLVKDIGLSDDGLAEVELELDADEVTPLHEGTRASVRSIGLSGVANRFVDLRPGPPSTAAIPSGGVLPATATRGIVDFDSLLNEFDPEVRRDVQGIVREAAVAVDAKTARQANAGLEMLNPALSRLTELGGQLTADQAALSSLLERTSSVAGVLARHRDGLARSLDAGAGVFTAIARERQALADSLGRAPASMRMVEGTLRRLRTRTLPAVDPLLERARPALPPLARLLRTAEPTLANARPLLDRLERLIPEARRVLSPLPELETKAVPAIAAIAQGFEDALPMISGLRPYTPELVSGFFSGFGGSTAHSYDANGHYARIFLESSPGSLNGLLPNPPGDSFAGYRTRLDARCPGAAEEPHPDGSNPWAEGAGSTCDPGHNR
jgi:phospholipid/cholesterol/gamma-HCH transport system substrate-binding protein